MGPLPALLGLVTGLPGPPHQGGVPFRGYAAPTHFRSQQHAPVSQSPAPLPHDTIELFVAGDADARKKDALPAPPAGCGVAAVESGSDERMFTICGQITTATPGVKTVTENLAALVAFTRALLWAAQDPLANPILARGQADRPISKRHEIKCQDKA